jgi:iron complex outermembrane receptor protein
VLSFALLAPGAIAATARTPATVTGVVKNGAGTPLLATVTLTDLSRRASTDEAGRFAFADVPPGHHVLRVEAPGQATAERSISTAGGESTSEEFTLEPFHYEETVIVSGVAGTQGSEPYQPASALSGAELSAVMQPSLGETLTGLPGVSSTWFGPAASRPIIRGLGGDRVRIMTNGLEVGDASSASPDHAVAADPLTAGRIEVVRGPATLAWGSNAIGGVVNVIDDRIPREAPGKAITGTFQALGSSGADEVEGALVLDGGVKHFAWHVDGFRRDAGDVRVPGGRLVNSALEGSGKTAGIAWVGERGHVGVAVSELDSFYGSPAEEEVSIDLSQRRFDAEGEVRWAGQAIRRLGIRAGRSSYEHVELEGDEVGTRFLNDSDEVRVEIAHAPAGPFEGRFGVQWTDREFSALGDESFVPPTDTRTTGVFWLEDAHVSEAWTMQLGARYEERRADAAGDTPATRHFAGLSASVSVLGELGHGWSFSTSLARSVKFPGAEELYADGPHLATHSFEVGDRSLGNEIGLGADVAVRQRSDHWSMELDLFVRRFSDFIREAATGAVEDGLPVFQFLADDADFRGGEIHAEVDLNRDDQHHVRLIGGLDFVRARLADGGDPLPRIPPLEASLGVRYDGPRWWALVRETWADGQDRVAPLESPTDGYALLETALGYRFVASSTVHDFVLRGTNLTDELARNHASFLKDVAPLPGRSVSLTYRIVF